MTPKPSPSHVIDAPQAFTIARDWAKANGFPFEHDYSIIFLDGRWHISTHCGVLGGNLNVEIDAETGEIREHDWCSE